MPDGIDPREFGALEAEVRHLRHGVANLGQQLAAVSAQMTEMQRLLASVQGARWTLATLATLASMAGGVAAWAAGWLKFGH